MTPLSRVRQSRSSVPSCTNRCGSADAKHTIRTAARSARGTSQASPLSCARVSPNRSSTYKTPPVARCSNSCGLSASCDAAATKLLPVSCSARANTSAIMPASPRSNTGPLACANCCKRRRQSCIAAERPSAATVSAWFAIASPLFSARLTVARSFCNVIGFSRKSRAPMRIASTALSMLAWPDIITTGIVNCPLAAHSLSSEMPSVSGIQMSSSTSSGRA